MGLKLFALYLVLGFISLDTERSKTKVPVSLHLETVIADSDDAILGRFGGATITQKGEILFTDASLKTVLVFNSEGDYITKFGREGRGPGEFQIPKATTTDKDGFIYVEDFINTRISVWYPDFTYYSDIPFRSGWGTHFLINKNHLLIFTKPFAPLQNGYDAVIISKINRNNKEASPFFLYEIRDWFEENLLFVSASKLAITDSDIIVSTGKIDQYPLRLINLNGDVLKEFGKNSDLVFYTEEEMQLRIDYANNINPEAARIIAQGRRYKHIYSNIEICNQNWLWVHRNKEFGARDELDIYSLDGEYKTMVTIPPSDNELQMLGIYGEKVLFHVTTPTGEERLHVYRIEYSDE